MSNNLKVFGVLVLTFFFFNCENLGDADVTPLPEIQDAPVNIEYNRNAEVLEFSSLDAFNNFMGEITKEPIEKLKENPKLRSFYSLSDYNYDLNAEQLRKLRTTSDDDKEGLIPDNDDAIVYDPYFASVLNENREILVGELRFRIIEEGVIISKNKDVKDAQKFVKDVKEGKIKNKDEVTSTDKITFYPEKYLNPDKMIARNARVQATSCPYFGGGLFGHNHECFQEYGEGLLELREGFGLKASHYLHQWGIKLNIREKSLEFGGAEMLNTLNRK